MNPANWITVGRIVLVPVFLFLAYLETDGGAIAALIVFVVASASDRLDGYLARKHEMISRLGEFLDPSADKLLIGAALWVLVDLHEFPLWAALLIGIREIVIQVLRTRIVARGGSLPASITGKLKTVLQIVMVCWWLYPAEPNEVQWIMMFEALAVTLASGAKYLVQPRTTEKAQA